MSSEIKLEQLELEPEYDLSFEIGHRWTHLRSSIGDTVTRISLLLRSSFYKVISKINNSSEGQGSSSLREDYEEFTDSGYQQRSSPFRGAVVILRILAHKQIRLILLFGIGFSSIEALGYALIDILSGQVTNSLVESSKKGFRGEAEANYLAVNCGETNKTVEELKIETPPYSASQLDSYVTSISLYFIIISIMIIITSNIERLCWNLVDNKLRLNIIALDIDKNQPANSKFNDLKSFQLNSEDASHDDSDGNSRPGRAKIRSSITDDCPSTPCEQPPATVAIPSKGSLSKKTRSMRKFTEKTVSIEVDSSQNEDQSSSLERSRHRTSPEGVKMKPKPIKSGDLSDWCPAIDSNASDQIPSGVCNLLPQRSSSSLSQKTNWLGEDEIANDSIPALGNVIKHIIHLVISLIVSFSYSYKLTSAVILTSLILVSIGFYMNKLSNRYSQGQGKIVIQSKLIEMMVEELVSSRDTIGALCGYQSHAFHYEQQLNDCRRMEFRVQIMQGSLKALSILMIHSFLSSLAYLMPYLMITDDLDASTVIVVASSLVNGAFSLKSLLPSTMKLVSKIRSLSQSSNEMIMAPEGDNRALNETGANAFLEFNEVVFRDHRLRLINLGSFDMAQNDHVVIYDQSGELTSKLIYRILIGESKLEQGFIALEGKFIQDINVNSIVTLVDESPVIDSGNCSFFDYIATNNLMTGWDLEKLVKKAAKQAKIYNFIKKHKDEFRCPIPGETITNPVQMYRLNLARSICNGAKLFILEEPSKGSPLSIDDFLVILQDIRETKDHKSTLVIMRSPLGPSRSSELVLFLQGGRVIEQGPFIELMNLEGEFFEFMFKRDDVELSGSEKNDSRYTEMIVPNSDTVLHNESFDSNRTTLNRATSHSIYIEREVTTTSERITNDAIETTQLSHSIGRKYTSSFQELIYDKSNRMGNNNSLKNLILLFRDEWSYLGLVLVISITIGLMTPILGWLLAEFIRASSIPIDQLLSFGAQWSGQMVAYGFVLSTLIITQSLVSNYAIGLAITRIRVKSMKNLIGQHCAYFDRPENSPESIKFRLVSCVEQVKNLMLIAVTIWTISSAIGVSAMLMSFTLCWPLTIAIILLAPLVAIIYNYLMKSENLPNESIQQQKTFDNLDNKLDLMDMLKQMTSTGMSVYLRSSIIPIIPNLMRAVLFGCGTHFITIGFLTTENMYRILLSFAISILVISYFSTNCQLSYKKPSFEAIGIVQAQLDCFRGSDLLAKGGVRPPFDGSISFTDVYFCCPIKTTTEPILRGVNLTVKPGQILGLVGPRGSGKSTLLSLLMRFHEPTRGSIKMGKFDIQFINMVYLRQRIGFICHKPIVFRISIKENIIYGLDSSRYSMRKIVEAAKKAKVHDFISGLVRKYDSIVGVDRDAMELTLVDKHQINLARIFLRKPNILLLDNPTAGLDDREKVSCAFQLNFKSKTTKQIHERSMRLTMSQISQAVLNPILDEISEGKTCIRIAEEASELGAVDEIAVMKAGFIVEIVSQRDMTMSEYSSNLMDNR